MSGHPVKVYLPLEEVIRPLVVAECMCKEYFSLGLACLLREVFFEGMVFRMALHSLFDLKSKKHVNFVFCTIIISYILTSNFGGNGCKMCDCEKWINDI
jgi:hypothetical protein